MELGIWNLRLRSYKIQTNTILSLCPLFTNIRIAGIGKEITVRHVF